MLIIAVAMTSALWLAAPTAAQMYDPAELAHKRSEQFANVEYTIREQLFAPLPADIKSRLGRIALDMPLYDDVQRGAPPFTAYADSLSKEIILPVETLHFWGDMGLIFAWFEARSCPIPPVLSYLYQVVEEGVRTPPMEAFALDRQRLIADDFVDRLSLRITNTALNFVLAHEMGHLFYNHVAARDFASSQAQERAADSFAMDVLADLRLQPFGVAYFFLGARYLEGYSWDVPFSTHPSSPERMEYIAGRIRANPDTYFPAGLPERRRLEERERMLAMAGILEQIARNMRDDLSFGIQTRLLPQIYPLHRLSHACPAL